MEYKIEWEYFVILGAVVVLSLIGWQKGSVSDIHVLFAIGGAIFTIITFIAFREMQVSGINIGNSLLQASITSLALGFPSLFNPPQSFNAPAPVPILVGTAAEEILRIAAFLIFAVGFKMPRFAVGVSGVVFAAMHLYWQPGDWVSAIVSGILFSILLLYLGSQTACVVSHFAYDIVAFGYIAPWLFILINFITLICGTLLIYKKKQVII